MEIEEKLLLAKINDKITISKTRNKIQNTEFLTPYQKETIKKDLAKQKIQNYIFFGGYEGAEGEALIIYPEKLGLDLAKRNLKNILKAIKIKLPKELKSTYTHRDYLGSCMKTGLNRDRIGDIIVHEDKAYIIVLKENAEYIVDFLKNLTRFSKSEITIIDCDEIELKPQEFEEIKITIPSMRLDSIVSETIKYSRNKAEELITEEKVYVNAKLETKSSKTLKEGDILAIRGKGKYIIAELMGSNKKGKTIALIKKYK